jgi:hypothetical protein
VVESGTYKDLADNERSHFRKYLNAYNESMTNGKDREQKLGDDFEGEMVEDMLEDISLNEHVKSDGRKSKQSSKGSNSVEKPLMTDEMAEREIGKVGAKVYLTWARAAGGLWIVIPLFLVFAVGQGSQIFSNWWLTYWSHAATPDSASQLHFLGIYAAINVWAILAEFCRMFVVLYLGLRASVRVS